MAPEIENLKSYCEDVGRRARAAAAALMDVTGGQKNDWLARSASALRDSQTALSEANAKDLDAAPGFGLTEAQVDRLRLTPARVESIALALEEVAMLPDPVGRVLDSNIRPNGLEVQKIQVPLGVIFFIYESRPNVTADAAAICIKSGNAVILRGGKEAIHSSRAICDLLAEAARDVKLPADAVQLVATTDREAVGHFLRMPEMIDVTIPRGGEGLIRRVVEEAQMPVIKHFAGNCHVYVDRHADPEMAVGLVVNSKCQRMGVCNAAESLLIHEEVAASLLPLIAAALDDNHVEMRGDAKACSLVPGMQPATDDDFATEYLGPTISVAIVDSLDAAVEHIHRFGSGHTETIVTRDLDAARTFVRRVDSSAVLVNASTRFNDGGQFGLGAEIGISTDKLHARGPCGINELTSYKYVVYGTGQQRH